MSGPAGFALSLLIGAGVLAGLCWYIVSIPIYFWAGTDDRHGLVYQAARFTILGSVWAFLVVLAVAIGGSIIGWKP